MDTINKNCIVILIAKSIVLLMCSLMIEKQQSAVAVGRHSE